jgi:hypothetical protein
MFSVWSVALQGVMFETSPEHGNVSAEKMFFVHNAAMRSMLNKRREDG